MMQTKAPQFPTRGISEMSGNSGGLAGLLAGKSVYLPQAIKKD